MAKEVSLKLTYLQAPGIRKPTVEKLHEEIKEGGYSFFQKNPQYAPSFLLFASGVKSKMFGEEIKKAPEKGIDSESVSLLEDANLKLKTIEEENPALFQDLSESFQEASPQIELVEYIESPEYISFRPSNDNSSYELAPSSSFGKLDVDIGPAKEIASLGLNKILEPVKKKIVETGAKAVTKAAASVATKAGIQAAAQTIGTSVPIIGNIAAWVATTIIGGILDRLALAIKKRSKEVQDFLMGGPLALLQLLSGIFTGLSLILTTFLAAIVTPILVAMVTIPVVIAVIVFIINSGAYLVPPSDILAPGENPYIEITKIASQTEFENSDLPVSVTYTITVTPLRGSLTNISITHVCEILSRRPTDNCPAPLPIPVPTLISPTEPYVYTYTVLYTQADADYRDSLVINTFSVTADTDEVTQTTATGAASVIIGDPPTGCYTFEGTWDANYQNMLLGAISTLTSRYTRFVQQVCAGGQPVRLEYTQSLGCPGAWACAFRSGLIRFNGGGLSNPNGALYILTHESGHIVDYRIGSLFQQYEDWPGVAGERPLCSYGATSDPAEAFAESAALYVASMGCSTPSSYPSIYPAHYSFADTVLF